MALLQQMLAALKATVSKLTQEIGALRVENSGRLRSRYASRKAQSGSRSSLPSVSTGVRYYHRIYVYIAAIYSSVGYGALIPRTGRRSQFTEMRFSSRSAETANPAMNNSAKKLQDSV